MSFSAFCLFEQQMFHQVYYNLGISFIVLAIISISDGNTVLPAEIWEPAQIQTVWSWGAKTLVSKCLETSSKARGPKARLWV